jgi:hypothetical protein
MAIKFWSGDLGNWLSLKGRAVAFKRRGLLSNDLIKSPTPGFLSMFPGLGILLTMLRFDLVNPTYVLIFIG